MVTRSTKPLQLDVLAVDDEKRIRSTLRVCLQALGCRVEEAANGPALRAALDKRTFDLVLLDLRLGEENGLDFLPVILGRSPKTDVVIITAFATIETAVQATQMGARSYLAKPFGPPAIRELVERIAARRTLDGKIEDLRARIGTAAPEIELSTESPRLRALLQVVARAAAQSEPLLLQGEPGTGKRTMARRVHALSSRAAAPFVAVSVRGRSEDAILRELFGQAEEAFLDDPVGRPGRIEAAAGGSLYIDEVGELPPRAQARLARLLAGNRFERAGETQVREADVRLIGATAYDLEKEVRAGRFRADLLARWSRLATTVPPLRERREDILPLARRYLAFFSQTGAVKAPELTMQAETALLGYAWPGNLRELREAMERAAILRSGLRVDIDVLPDRVASQGLQTPYVGGEFSLDSIEREHILRVLASAPTHDEASRILGIDISTLWRKRKRYQSE
jgi:NtrC-family two-component system response regulator AlgB